MNRDHHVASIKRFTSHPLFPPIMTLLLLLVVSSIVIPNFLRITWLDGHLNGSLIDVLNRAAPLILVSIGMMLVIAARGLDISVGAVVAITAAVAAMITTGSYGATHSGLSTLFVAIIGALATATLCGLWNGLLVVKIGMQPIIATLILMVAGRGIAQLITDGQIITIYYAPYFYIGNGFLFGVPFALIIALLTAIGLHLLVTRTALGLFIRAIGLNPVAAHVAGVRSRMITLCLYIFCGFAAGLAGLIISSNIKSADGNNAGQLMELDAILAVTLGGTALTGGRFTVMGTVIGALIIQALTSMIYASGLPPQVNLAVKALLVFAVMLLQSSEFRNMMHRLVFKPKPSAST